MEGDHSNIDGDHEGDHSITEVNSITVRDHSNIEGNHSNREYFLIKLLQGLVPSSYP